jgi:5-(carboxyamino)imidazole ribonucleotide synthase
VTRVGIIGGGQLGRMLALAGYPLGITCTTLDPAVDSPAAAVAPAIVGAYDHRDRLTELASAVDVVTYEFENVPVDAARFVANTRPVFPPPASLEASQDRLAEKRVFESVGLAVPPYAQVDDGAMLAVALEGIGTPAVLKTRRLGYDGKGQSVIGEPGQADASWRTVGEVASIAETLVAFDRELSIVAVRGRDGAMVFYPLVENHHRNGILRLTKAPAPGVPAALQAEAERYAASIMSSLDHVGVLAIELFQAGDELLGNEMAPRVHNSGHWTDVGAATSQFENHLRAIAGLPLGSTAALAPSAMVNIVGTHPDRAAVLAVPGARLHDYGKQARPGRKLGHVTVLADDADALERRIERLTSIIGEGEGTRRSPNDRP